MSGVGDSTRKIVVIVAASLGRSSRNIPLGAARVVSALKAHTATSASVDAVLLSALASDDAGELANAILERRPWAVGFSLYVWNRPLLSAVARIVRERSGDILLFAGGPEATADPAGALADGRLDFTVAGEGEDAAPRTLALALAGESPAGVPGFFTALGRSGTPAAAVPRALADLSRIPSPYLDGVLDPAASGGALWELARGCPFSCFFCYESKGCKGVRRFPESVAAAELKRFADLGIGEVFVLDPTFNADPTRAREILRRIRREAPGTHFSFEARAEFLDAPLAREFASIPCSVQIGLQSARPEVLASVGRPGFSRKEFRRKTALLSSAGVVFGLDLIFGLPGDDLDGFRNSLDYALSLEPNHLDVFRLSVLPGTVLWDRADEFGLRREPAPPYRVLSTPTFPAADLEAAEALARACDLFYSQGRAVGWFAAALRPLRKSPSVFFRDIAAAAGRFLADRSDSPVESDHASIERFQLEVLASAYRNSDRDKSFPAVHDMVRLHGAWSRALAEGKSSTLELSWDPDVLFGTLSRDPERLVRTISGRRASWSVRPGRDGPIVEPLGRGQVERRPGL